MLKSEKAKDQKKQETEDRLLDGLYQVRTPHLCAGFVVEKGRISLCAPILKKRLSYWITQAKKI